MRIAVVGLNRYAFDAAAASAAWRSGVKLSRIQKPRPCVPATRSEHIHDASSFTSISRTEIAGMLRRSECHWSPSSNDTQICVSVDAYSRPFLRGSSRIELATAPPAMPLSISVQVLPLSCVRQKCGFMSSRRRVLAAAYAVLVSKWPASMLKMRVQGLIWDGVTSVHFAPPSVVSWRTPSPVPAQSTFTSSDEGASAVIEPNGEAVTVEAYLPALVGAFHAWRVRSPLMAVQL